MYKLFIYILVYVFIINTNKTYSQELIAKVQINTEDVGSNNKVLYNTLAMKIQQLINSTRFTNIEFSNKERIDSKFIINITQSKDKFKQAEIIIQASRPVYNTTYRTSIFLYKDSNLNFEYSTGNNLSFNNQSLIDNNLSAIIIYYSNVIISFYLDSFYKENHYNSEVKNNLNNIISIAQSNRSWNGWDLMSQKDRISIYKSLQSDQERIFHELWYNYHINGVDLLESDPEKGRINIINTIKLLFKLNDLSHYSEYLKIFEKTKVDEIINIFKSAPEVQRMELYDYLIKIYPSIGTKLNAIKSGGI